MRVNFNGLYKITGKPGNVTGTRKTLNDLSDYKIGQFLYKTKEYREPSGFSYFSEISQDYYLVVKDECEIPFEYQVNLFNLDCQRVGEHKIASNSASATREIKELSRIRSQLWKLIKF